MADDKSFRRRRRGAVLYAPIAALLIIVIIIFGISVFFRITTINVQGAVKYTKESIIGNSGIKIGDNLILIDADAVAEKLKTNLPYLSDVEVDRIIPDTVNIIVTESQPIAVVSYNGTWWILDQKGRVLEKLDDNTAVRKKIEVQGISPTSIAIGRPLIVGDSEQTKLLYLANVLSALQSAGIASDVRSIDVSNIGNIKFDYAGRFTVILGTGEDADYKMVKFQDVMAKLMPDDRGKIDVSNNPARFIPG